MWHSHTLTHIQYGEHDCDSDFIFSSTIPNHEQFFFSKNTHNEKMQSNPYRRIHTQQPIQMHSNAKIKVLELREDFQQ